MKYLVCAILLTLLIPIRIFGGEEPVELGAVAWGRDHDAAFLEARESKRPVLLLFQEIPG